MKFGGHFADIPAEPLWLVIDDVVDLATAAPVDRAAVAFATSSMWIQGPICRSSRVVPTTSRAGRTIRRAVRRGRNKAVAQHDSLGVAVLTGRRTFCSIPRSAASI